MSKKKDAIDLINRLVKKYGKGCIFRGTTGRFSLQKRKDGIRDGINSTLYRSVKAKFNEEPEDLENFFGKHGKIFLAITEREISENALKVSPNNNELDEVLTDIQHRGGNTKNIDFSYDIFIALFFACQEDFDKCGELIILHKDKDKNSLEKEGIKITDAANSKDSRYRISFQQSVFARSEDGFINPKLCKIEKIDKDLKAAILEYLWEKKRINRDTVYGDSDPAAHEFYAGLASQAKGEHKNAVAHYSALIQKRARKKSAPPVVYNNRGNARVNMKQYALAIKDYDKAISLKSDYDKAYFNRGNAYSSLRKYELAIKDYEKAISLAPDFAEAYNNMGKVYSALGQYPLALKCDNKATLLKPDYPEAYNNRGNIYYRLRKYDLAIKDYGKAISLKPDFVEAYNNRGNAYSDLGKFMLAIEDYDMAIQLNPDFAPAYYNRGLAKEDMGDTKGAKADFDKAKKLGLTL